MTPYTLALRSLLYYWRTNLALALGVAAATAVLTGALIVGDSMRSSLRGLTMDRLGHIDELLISDHFFSEKLAEDIQELPAFRDHYSQAAPAILFPSASVAYQSPAGPSKRSGNITLLGIHDSFWAFDQPTRAARQPLKGQTAIINRALAEQLAISDSDVQSGTAKITVRIPKQNQLPPDSPMAKQDDLIESIVDLQVIEIVSTSGLGGFNLYPTQSEPFNVYLSIELLQESLEPTVLKHKADSRQANVLFLSGRDGKIPNENAGQMLAQQMRPSLQDFGLSLKPIQRTFNPNRANPSRGNDSNPSAESKTEETIFEYVSLSTERLVFPDAAAEIVQAALQNAKPIFTYLANDIRPSDLSEESQHDPKSGIPFSMIAAIDFDDSFRPISLETGEPIASLKPDEIVLVQWAANDLNAKVGDLLDITYFEPETTHGNQIEKVAQFRLVDIAKLTEPHQGYLVPRRGAIEPAQFSQRPEVTNDPDLTPEVPGVTDAESIERWDLPFETASKIRPQDDQYWNDHRTTPKAFVSLATGQKLWNSRFGKVTNFRLPSEEIASIERRLLPAITPNSTDFGFQLVPLKERGLAASAGSTPFDILFLALSMFVIGSALILVALLFRLSIQQRAAEAGILSAVGFSSTHLRSIWLTEMGLVSLIGAILGVLLGIGYAAIMIWGLSTWWVGAISRPFLQLHVSPTSIAIGIVSGTLVCIATIAWSLRAALKQDTKNLLSGLVESGPTRIQHHATPGRSSRIGVTAIGGLLLAAVTLTILATRLTGESQAGSFMGAGFLALVASLLAVYRSLKRPRTAVNFSSLDLTRIALMNARRNPLRSTLTIGLVAVASFLIAAVSAFRLSPTEQGTGGFDWIAKSSHPILADLSTDDGIQKLLGSTSKSDTPTTIIPIRYRQGEDASCNNLYQSTRPQVLGLPKKFIEHFERPTWSATLPRFAWANSLDLYHGGLYHKGKMNPWRWLERNHPSAGTEMDPIPTIIDKNTANYSLKIYSLGTIFPVNYDDGRTIYFRVVGFLSNSIFQGSLLIGESDFVNGFPNVGGYQYFLIEDGQVSSSPAILSPDSQSTVGRLEDHLVDYGFEVRSAVYQLNQYLRVQNTYLSTFQTLGALGLLLGTFGLSVVQLRAVLERRKELGLLQAVGYSPPQLRRLVLLETAILLGIGLAVGVGAALFTTLPHGLLGNASVPWIELGLMFGAIGLVGLLASLYASKQLLKLPLLESLRG